MEKTLTTKAINLARSMFLKQAKDTQAEKLYIIICNIADEIKNSITDKDAVQIFQENPEWIAITSSKNCPSIKHLVQELLGRTIKVDLNNNWLYVIINEEKENDK